MATIEIDRNLLVSLIRNYDEMIAWIEPELRDGFEDYLARDISQIRDLVE